MTGRTSTAAADRGAPALSVEHLSKWFGDLDPLAARDVHQLIAAPSRSGVTIFLTTHRLEEAERLCDRVAT